MKEQLKKHFSIFTYAYIDELAINKDVNTLYTIFTPYMKNTIYTLFKAYRFKIEYEELEQEAFIVFHTFVMDYDTQISSFTYYVKTMFYYDFTSYIRKKYKYIKYECYSLSSYYIDNRDFFSLFVSLYNDYTAFINTLTIKSIHKTLIYDYFLDNMSITNIAIKYNISPSAVYQSLMICLYKTALFVNASKYVSFTIDLTHIYNVRGKIQGSFSITEL